MIRVLYKPADARRSWREAVAGSLGGTIFALVKSAVDRGTAACTRKSTGAWPGDEGQPSGQEA